MLASANSCAATVSGGLVTSMSTLRQEMPSHSFAVTFTSPSTAALAGSIRPLPATSCIPLVMMQISTGVPTRSRAAAWMAPSTLKKPWSSVWPALAASTSIGAGAPAVQACTSRTSSGLLAAMALNSSA